MNIGECSTIIIPIGGKLRVTRLCEDEYEVDLLQRGWNRRDSFLEMENDKVAGSFSIITCPGNDLRILLMDMIWQSFGIQMGYHQVINLIGEGHE